MAINPAAPVKSPSLAEYGPAIIVDENGNQLPVEGVVFLDANGHSGLNVAISNQVGESSQVTGRQQAPLLGAKKIPCKALVAFNSAGLPVPLGVAISQGLAKFQSAVRVATGASESIAHGLGVVPSLVLVSVYDLNGAVASVIVEGVHTTTNILVTVTANVKYKVIAFA